MKPQLNERDVVSANREFYERRDYDAYESNPAVFDPGRQQRIRSLLQSLNVDGSSASMLDVGCGTGNVIKLADGIFERRFGIDLSGSLLAELDRRAPGIFLCQSEAARLPFPDESFHLCTSYAVLHHLHSHERVFREIHRVLRPDGVLYTDHDPNYYFSRYHHFYVYRIRRKKKSSVGKIAEYHHTQTDGLNPDALADQLTSAGFRHVEIKYRLTDNPALPAHYKLIVGLMRLANRVYPFKSLHTHFLLIARK